MTLQAAPNRPPSAVQRSTLPERVIRAVVGGACRAYMRAWHQLRVEDWEHFPQHGPALVVINHNSILDVLALMTVSYPRNSTMVAKSSLWRIAPLRPILNAWHGIPVDRQGRDLASVRTILSRLKDGWIIGIAGEGRRSRSGGHLEPINPVLARIALSARVPIVPIGIAGTQHAMPPGARLPRREPITMRCGEPFELPRDASVEDAQRILRQALATLLPADQQPLEGV